MKKAISLFLALVMMISMSVSAFAAESSEEYYTIQVEYSDNTGHQESLDIMIQNDNVFVDAEMLAERLGYTFGENGESAVIFNKDTSNNLPFGITQFKYNSTQVSHMLFNNMIDTYEAPFASVKNNEGSWIPFEYSLLLFNSGMMITDDAVLIDIPTKRIIDYFFDVAKNSTKYGFDWADDFGYMETDIKVLGGSSHLINVFNGVLGFDGASWASLFQQFAGSMDSYDKKYGENLAILLCTESDKELQATTEKVKLLSNLLNEDGDLGKLLSFTSDMTDFQVGSLYKQCEAVLDGIKAGNSSAVDYSRAYQALEKALDKQTWFSHTGGNTLDIQKGVSSATGKVFNFLDIGVKVAEIVGYAQEFQNQDEFSLAAFTHYLESANSGLELPDAMKTSMVNYSDALSKAIDGYMVKRFLDNIDQWMSDAAKEQVPLHEVLGTQAAAALIAWDIASKTIPFIANGLSGADNFELALYSMVFQGDTFLNYLSKRDSVFANAENITAEHMYELSQYCYIYLKSCYVTREAALASLANKPDSTKEKIQPLIDYQNSINTEIAEIMVELKRANKTNDGLVFGFLPTDNKDYLSKYDDSQFIQWIETLERENSDIFSLLPSEFVFSSGAGGWATEITLNDDGTFKGQYYDSDMGDTGTGYSNGTVYICDFSGKFTMQKKINEYIYSMNLESLDVEGTSGTVYYENDIRYIVSDPYGFDNADEFLIYLPGCPLEETSEEFLSWSFINTQIRNTIPTGVYGIYNVGGMEGFMGEDDNSLWRRTYTYSYNSYRSELQPSYYSESHLNFWPESGAATLVLGFDWSDDDQTEFIASDYRGTGEYNISLDFREDFSSVLVTVKSMSGFNLEPWGGTADGILSVEYQIQ